MKILEIIENVKENQRKIAIIEAKAQAMQQRANQFILEGPEAQAAQIAEAEVMLQAQQIPGEAEIEEQEAEMETEMLPNNPDDN